MVYVQVAQLHHTGLWADQARSEDVHACVELRTSLIFMITDSFTLSEFEGNHPCQYNLPSLHGSNE